MPAWPPRKVATPRSVPRGFGDLQVERKRQSFRSRTSGAEPVPVREYEALDYALVLEAFDLGRVETEVLGENFVVMLAKKWGAANVDRRIPKLHRASRHRELATHRMLHRDDHPALAQMRVVEQFDAVEHLAARHAGLAEDLHHLMLGVRGGPLVDSRGYFFDVMVARAPILEALIGGQFRAAHRIAQVRPHLGCRTENVYVVVVAAGRASVSIGGSAGGYPVAHARDRLVRDVGTHHWHAAEVEDCVLHRELDLLPLAGALALDIRRQHADRRVHPRACVADRGAGLERWSLWRSGQRHRPARGLRDHVEAFVLAIRAVSAEAFDGQVDQARIDLVQPLPSETPALQRAERKVLGQNVDLLYQFDENFLAALVLEVERDRALVGVEQHEVVRVDAGLLGQLPSPLLSGPRIFQLDYVRPEPRQHFRA